MGKKLKIFSLYNKEVPYLRLHIESFKKYMDSPEFELVIVNGSINHRQEINSICEEYGVRVDQFFGNPGLSEFSYGSQLYGWFVENYVRKEEDYILLVHPDMFFFDRIDPEKILGGRKIVFVPRYHVGILYMWEGVILFDCHFLNSTGLSQNFDITGIIKGVDGYTDGSGSTKYLLDSMDPKDYGFFEFWNLHSSENGEFVTVLSGHAGYKFNLTDRRLIQEKGSIGPILGNRTYPYEQENENYEEYYINNFVYIERNFIDGFGFPSPTHIDVVCLPGEVKNPFIIHFKSGSGYQSFFNDHYRNTKLESLKKLILEKQTNSKEI